MTNAAQHTITRRLIAGLAALAVLLAPLAMRTAWAQQDTLAQARQHYQAGKDLFSAGDYRGAIREFESANRLSPSPVLHFNLGLAYENLGDKNEALRRYRAYLQEVPNASNRDLVQSKISRIEAELRAGAGQGQDPARTGPQAPANGQGTGQVTTGTPTGPTTGPATGVPTAPTTGSSTGATAGPATGPTTGSGGLVSGTSTRGREGQQTPPAPDQEPAEFATGFQQQPAAGGDSQLDRVAAVNVAAIRDQRAPLMGQQAAAAPAEPRGDSHQNFGETPKKSKPVYKQVWFWVVVGVSAIILLDIAASGSSSDTSSASAPILLRF